MNLRAGLSKKIFRKLFSPLIRQLRVDATCSYFKTLLPETIRVERIGFGVPIGGSLEYLDPMTITKALENRKRF